MGAILWIYTLFGWARWAVPGWFDVDIQSGVAEIMTDPKTASGKRIMEELHTMPGVHAMLKPFGAPGFKWRPLSQMRWLPSVSHAPFWDGTPVWAIKLPLWIPAIGFGIPGVESLHPAKAPLARRTVHDM
jgi:hypothetical protein